MTVPFPQHVARALCRAAQLAAAIIIIFCASHAVQAQTVTNTNDSGAGSLRQAIIDANNTAGTQTISFNIPGAGVQTIKPLTPLPNITDPVIIDGYTQPGASANTLATGDNAVLLIELDGSLIVGGSTGLRITNGGSTVRGLVVNLFNGTGISLLNVGGNTIEGCFIGPDADGLTFLASSNGTGIDISNSPNNTIGGTSPAARNLISGNRLGGISIVEGSGSFSADNCVVQGNYIGTDRNGTTALGNGATGVSVTGGAVNTRIGGTTVAARNLISGNVNDGVRLFSSGNFVQGNFIGTNATGTAAVGNRGFGVFMQSTTNNLVGGDASGPGQPPGNVISGNNGAGISLNGSSAPGNVFAGNLIGTNAAGTAALGNGGVGISLLGDANTVGGTTAAARNVISANGDDAIALNGNANVIRGNFIGTDILGTANLGNNGEGVFINSKNDNVVGGAGAGDGNVIAFNNGNGVRVNFFSTGTGNLVRGNSIFANARLGINLISSSGELPSGVSPNDAGDADTGANNLQNFPVLTSAASFNGSTNVQGTLNSAAGATFTVEFFSNTTCDASGNGEGQTFLGSTQVTTDASGNAVVNATLASTTTIGQVVTATATDAAGNTSEFSACTTVTAPAQSFAISGRVVDALPAGIPGAVVTLSGSASATTTTDSTGSYSFTNLAPGGNYTVTAANANYSFSPASQTFNNLTTNRTANFIGTQTIVSIGGRVTDTLGNAVANVTVSLGGSQTGTTTTDAAGNYSFGGLAAGGNYTVTPSGGAYSPAGQQFNNLRANAAADFTLISALACTPPPTGMVAWYPGDGSANDILGGNNGTLQNGAAFAPGKVGQAFSFDGVDDRVQVPTSPRLDITGNQLTIDAWVRPSGGGQRQVVSKAAGEPSFQRKYGMYVSLNNSLGFELRTTAGTIDLEGGTVPNDVFTHIAVTYDGSFMNWYVNGQPVRTQAQTGNIVPTSTDLIVGQFATDGLSTFNGLLDEVEIFDRALSQTEIQAIFDAGSAGKCKLSTPSAAVSGRVTNGLAGLAGFTVTLSGAVSGTVQTDAGGNYAFTNLTAGGNYTVTAQSPAFTFAPSRADFAALSGSVVANFSAVPVAAPTPPLTDNFDSNQRDAQKWSIGTLTQPVGAFDPQVTVVQQNGRLVITPRAGLAGRHYNGYVSVNSFDFTNARAVVEVPQVATGGAETIFGIGSDNQNYFRFVAGPSNSPGLAKFAPEALEQIGVLDVAQVLVFQVRVAGTVSQEVIPYDPVAHRFWRFRHDAPANAIVFETSPDNSAFTERYRKTLEKSVSALAVELTAGTAAPASGGGPAVFDNLSLVASTAQFAAANFTVAEDGVRATITVTRSGSVSASPATLTYATVDNPAAVRCDNTTTLPGVAFARCDYATTIDTLTFAAGETQKTFSVPIIDDAQVEGDETFALVLRDATGASLGAPARITVTITDNDQPGQANPVFSSPFFIRQQYLDFLSREPDAPGFNAYLNLLNNCPDVNNLDPNAPSAACDRITVSAAFFGSPEFRLKGFYVFTFYQVAFNGRLPVYADIVSDMRAVTGRTSAETFQKRAAFATNFTQRADFKAAFDAKTDAEYVAALLARYNLTQITTPDPANPEGTQTVTLSAAQLTSQLTAGTLTRAQVLRAIVQSNEVSNAEFNRAFVGMQYYGYLRRTPDTPGYNAWLNYLTAHPDDFRTMVNGFMNSQEYRLRFGANQ